MKRREFIVLLSGSALSWPDSTLAQDRVRRIGMLMQYRESPEVKTWVAALEEGSACARLVRGPQYPQRNPLV